MPFIRQPDFPLLNSTMHLLARTKSLYLSSAGSRVLPSVGVELIQIVAAGENRGRRMITYQVIFLCLQLSCALTYHVFTEVLDDALNTLNAHWAKTHGMSLQRLVL
jgi:hypothetical protein